METKRGNKENTTKHDVRAHTSKMAFPGQILSSASLDQSHSPGDSAKPRAVAASDIRTVTTRTSVYISTQHNVTTKSFIVKMANVTPKWPPNMAATRWISPKLKWSGLFLFEEHQIPQWTWTPMGSVGSRTPSKKIKTRNKKKTKPEPSGSPLVMSHP